MREKCKKFKQKGLTRRPKWATQALGRFLADTTRPANSSTSKIRRPDLGTIRTSIKDELGLSSHMIAPPGKNKCQNRKNSSANLQ